jgi:DNA-binding transcriptional ArsR family regulator
MTPETLVGLLAEPTRMRVFAAVVLGATTPAEVATRTDLTTREVVEALRRLADGGLVTGTPP